MLDYLAVNLSSEVQLELVDLEVRPEEAEDGLCSAEVEVVYMGASLEAAGRPMQIEVLVQIDTNEMHLAPVDHLSYVENEVELLACAPLMKHSCSSG